MMLQQTILYSGGPGLQVQKDADNSVDDAKWVDVPDIPGAFIINLGDLMQRWTNSTCANVIFSPPGK